MTTITTMLLFQVLFSFLVGRDSTVAALHSLDHGEPEAIAGLADDVLVVRCGHYVTESSAGSAGSFGPDHVSSSARITAGAARGCVAVVCALISTVARRGDPGVGAATGRHR